LEDFAKGKDPYDPDTAEQFNDNPLKYWSYMSGGANKELHKVAKRVFSITVTTAAVECLFSNMGHLHSDRRNRLDVSNSIDIIYCYCLLLTNFINIYLA
jgi:hypothetical protein